MDLTSGSLFWPIKNGLLATYPPLLADAQCDVAVIGGGITGALVAYHLVSAGIDTLLLDKRDIGFGSTSASTGLLLYQNDVPLHRLIRKVGEGDAVRSFQLGREAIEKIAGLVGEIGGSAGFARRESWYAASAERDLAGLRTEYETLRRHGFSVEWWSKRELGRATALPHWGALLATEAGEIDAYRFTNALLAVARKKGLRAFDRTAVTAQRARRTDVELQTSRGPRVRARKVVVATGYEAIVDVARAPAALHSTYVVASEPLTSFGGWPERRLLWETARPYLYLRTTSDGRAIIGGYDEPFRDPQRRDRLLPRKARALVRRFSQFFPEIDFEMAYAWTGTFAETRDGLPYIGALSDRPHTYFALGYGGNGITYGLIAAEIIRDLCLGRKNSDASIFRFDR
jgi:glycine/D-amino acid oxidase-like deaminating enzyme